VPCGGGRVAVAHADCSTTDGVIRVGSRARAGRLPCRRRVARCPPTHRYHGRGYDGAAGVARGGALDLGIERRR
jgi:hypothetical protein